MIYTVGHKESYELGMLELGERFRKLGACEINGEPYEGGIAFLTKEEAFDYLKEHSLVDYDVYGLEANWETDTKQLPNETFHRLINSSRIVHADVG